MWGSHNKINIPCVYLHCANYVCLHDIVRIISIHFTCSGTMLSACMLNSSMYDLCMSISKVGLGFIVQYNRGVLVSLQGV